MCIRDSGYPIGHAIRDIKKGEHVLTDNIKTNLSGILEYKYEPQLKGVEKADEKAYLYSNIPLRLVFMLSV